MQGIIQVTRKGVGYLGWPDEPDKEDIEIDVRDLGGALNGDEVQVEVKGLAPGRAGRPAAKGATRFAGRVGKIVKRAKTEFVATIKDGLAIPDDQRFYKPIQVGDTPIEGEKVLIHLEYFDGQMAKGKVLQSLGRAGEHRTEMNAIVMEKGFRTDFPAEAEAEANEYEKRHAEIIAQELPKRADHRNLIVMTIDPKDAKDFDDALSIRQLPDGTFEVGVHIADASYYCAPGTAVDAEARKRGTSVYLVDATIPMLPHQISGGVASLKADEDRLAFSAMFVLDKNTRVLSKKFEKSVINSKKRFTYEEAQEVLDKQTGPYLSELNMLYGLAKIMRTQRQEEGAIDFGDNEVRFE
ncbi:MAG TPA: RNB domain-containing ribonuclease, partial [Candidatus Paceibacterota bacterium]|nr:RNB domain-containing ribonuclease [Candidatus Paceibacterota bacterium]